jgi:hypothetical protein
MRKKMKRRPYHKGIYLTKWEGALQAAQATVVTEARTKILTSGGMKED